MEKFFNNEIVDFLRLKNRKKSNIQEQQDTLYQDGDKFIWRKPEALSDKESGVNVSSQIKSALSSSNDPLITLYPEKSSTSSGKDDSSAVEPYTGSSLSSKVTPPFLNNRRREDLNKTLRRSSGNHEEITRIRALLGPFPDEPFLAALDNILYYFTGIYSGSAQGSISECDSLATCSVIEKDSSVS